MGGGARAKTMQNIRPEKLEEFKKLQASLIEEAAQYAEDAVFIIKGKDDRSEIKAMLRTAVVYLGGGSAEKAKDAIDEAAFLAKKAKQPDLEKECVNLSIDCAEVHKSKGEFSDVADIASEMAAFFKAQGNYEKAAAMLKMQIQAHIDDQEGTWALTTAKNDLVRLWKGVDKKEEALAHVEVAKIYLALRDTANVKKTTQQAVTILAEINEVEMQVIPLRILMQAYMADEATKDMKSAEKVAKQCVTLGKSSSNTKVEAYGLLWSGTVAAKSSSNFTSL